MMENLHSIVTTLMDNVNAKKTVVVERVLNVKITTGEILLTENAKDVNVILMDLLQLNVIETTVLVSVVLVLEALSVMNVPVDIPEDGLNAKPVENASKIGIEFSNPLKLSSMD